MRSSWKARWLAVAMCAGCEAGDSVEEPGEMDSAEAMEEHELMGGAVNGQCVPEGERFVDVYLCDSVEGPSPTQPPVSSAAVPHDPQTVADPDYAWVQAQAEACACTCCHREGGIGSYMWSHDFEGAWTDAATSSVLATLAFAAVPGIEIPPETNNGFTRRASALPTTDVDRLHAFFDRELERRGD